MPNNHADVPLLTAEMAGNIRDFFRAIEPAESEYPEDDASDDAALDAIAASLSITKSAAAEEADRARIVELEADNSNVRSQYSRALTALRALVETGRHCAYCKQILSGDDAVKVHMELCEKHPLAAARASIAEMEKALATADGYIIRSHDKHRPDWACKQCVGDGALPGADEDFVCVYHAAIARQALSGGSENG